MFRSILRFVALGAVVIPLSSALGQIGTGSIAVLGVNANNYACMPAIPANQAMDEISFVCFQPIPVNTTFWITDNGWNKQYTGFWGTGEGVVSIRRTVSALSAGQVITIRATSAGVVTVLAPDANWAITNISGSFNLNSGGDQMFFFLAGASPSFTNSGANQGTFNNCTLLYAFNTKNAWTGLTYTGAATCPGTGTCDSALPPGIDCFAMAPAAATDYTKYTGPVASTTQRQWIINIDNPANWTAYLTCTAYNSGGINYSAGYTIPILAGGYQPGYWIGSYSTNWFDCKNWDDAEVPTSATNVRIGQTYGSVNNCQVSGNTAYAQSVALLSAGVSWNLSVIGGGVLQVGTGGVTVTANSGTISAAGVTLGDLATAGTLTTTGNLTLTGTEPNPQRAFFRSVRSDNYASVAGNVTINPPGLLDLSNGGSGSPFHLGGNYSNNASAAALSEVGSTVFFDGSGSQSISTTGFQEDFGFLTLNKPSNDLTLNAPISIKSTLTLASGRIMTSNPGGLLTMTNTGTYNLTNPDLSFIHGPMVKVGPVSTHYFPVGKGTYTHGIRLNAITAGPTDAFIAEYFPSDPTVAIGAPFENPPLYGISTCEYWNLDQYAGAPTGRVSLGWNTNTNCGIVVPSALHVAHWDGLEWKDRGGFAVGTAATGSVTTTAAQETLFAPGGWWTFATITDENTLPIELLWFDARPDGSEVRLDWATASERDNDYFTIERSANGQEFEEVTRVDGAGNSVSTLSYMDYDRWPLPGTSFYRLRQTDFDGATSVSNMVPVTFSGHGGNGLVVLNDVDQVIGVHDFAVGGTVEVLDMTGRLVWKGRVEMEGRSYVPTSALGTGAYVLRVSDATRSESAPFVR